MKDHPKCDACDHLAIGYVVPCQHLTCAGQCYNEECETCTGPGWDADHDDNHIMAPGCGASGCHTDFKRICRLNLSAIQIKLENYFDDIYHVETFCRNSRELVAQRKEEATDEGSDMST